MPNTSMLHDPHHGATHPLSNAPSDNLIACAVPVSYPPSVDRSHRVLSDQEISQVLSATTAGFVRSCWQYWAPYLTLMLGLSAAEIAALHSDDLELRSGRWWLLLRRAATSSRTYRRRRALPIGRQLLDRGLVTWMQALSPDGRSIPLFPELAACKCLGGRVSYWFHMWGRYHWSGELPAPSRGGLQLAFEARMRRIPNAEAWLPRMLGKKGGEPKNILCGDEDLDAEMVRAVDEADFPVAVTDDHL